MKINSQLQVVSESGVARAVAAELLVEDRDLEQLLVEQSEDNDTEYTEDNTKSL